MPGWSTYLMQMAELAATKSKDETKVGAVLVAPDGRSTLLTAFNGPPARVMDSEERRARPAKYSYRETWGEIDRLGGKVEIGVQG